MLRISSCSSFTELHSRSIGTLRRTALAAAEGDRQQAILEVRRHAVAIDVGRHAQAALERARGDLHLVQAHRGCAAALAQAADPQQVAVHGHAQVAAPHARELGAHDHGVLGLEDVDVGLPVIAVQAIGELAESLRARVSPGLGFLGFRTITSPAPGASRARRC